MTIEETILSGLPYAPPFLFVDAIHHISEDRVEGSFYLRPELDFYRGHFQHHAVTPGVILTEIMAQIGLVCLGIYLVGVEKIDARFPFALTSTEISFCKPVYPEETVTVSGTKEYFRFGKLKCKVTMTNRNGDLVCEGTIAGIQLKQYDTA